MGRTREAPPRAASTLERMTRIIAGAAAMARLQVPPRGTRPTSDKVREALFSALDSMFEFDGARVLDLYAGSGALGLEALSRGAERATLVEQAASASRLARANADAVTGRLRTGSAEVVTASVRSFLATTGAEFDLVFIDPPYDLDNAALSADLDALAPRLHPDALVVVERSTRTGDFAIPAPLRLWRRRDYGETALHFLEIAS